jgi:hypothetical protein
MMENEPDTMQYWSIAVGLQSHTIEHRGHVGGMHLGIFFGGALFHHLLFFCIINKDTTFTQRIHMRVPLLSNRTRKPDLKKMVIDWFLSTNKKKYSIYYRNPSKWH